MFPFSLHTQFLTFISAFHFSFSYSPSPLLRLSMTRWKILIFTQILIWEKSLVKCYNCYKKSVWFQGWWVCFSFYSKILFLFSSPATNNEKSYRKRFVLCSFCIVLRTHIFHLQLNLMEHFVWLFHFPYKKWSMLRLIIFTQLD